MKSQVHGRNILHMVFIVVMLAIFITGSTFIQRTAAEGDNYNYLPIVQNCPLPSFPLINGDFEMGDTGWTLSPYYSGTLSSKDGITSHGGNLMAYFISSGIVGIPTGYIEQTFSVPVCSPYVSFWLSSISVCDSLGSDYCGGDLRIIIDGNTFTYISTIGHQNIPNPWKKIVIDLSTYQGNTIMIRFYPYTYRSRVSDYIDDITFQSYP